MQHIKRYIEILVVGIAEVASQDWLDEQELYHFRVVF